MNWIKKILFKLKLTKKEVIITYTFGQHLSDQQIYGYAVRIVTERDIDTSAIKGASKCNYNKQTGKHEVLIRYWVNIDELKRLAYAGS